MTVKNIVAYLGIFVLTTGFYSCKKSGDTPPPDTGGNETLPVLTMNDMSQPIATTNSTIPFYANISKASTNVVSVDYSIVDGTATSPKYFVAASGTLSIPVGKTQAIIDVQLVGDPTNLRQNNLSFVVQLSNPKFCTIGTATVNGTLLTEDGTYLPTDNSGYSTPDTYPGYTLAWSDEFSASSLDLTAWNQEIGNGSGGWGNHELEYYTNSTKNSFLSNGNLIIEARKEAINGFNYSSSRLTTQTKKNFKFGRIDIRAKLPVAKGLWPALWMLGSNISSIGWPACGETDIMELVGTYPGRVSGTAHYKDAAGAHGSKGSSYNLSSGDFSKQFHVFTLIWEQDTMKWLIDDQLFFTTTATDIGTGNYPFNADQFFIFNVAVGGDWPGPPDSSTSFPQRMFVDYVRVFQK
ncbi:MAG: family 16 glycosylhydrolase [Prolixibacteraceae bacterium]|jgi:beta-glucanase (GH16 family)